MGRKEDFLGYRITKSPEQVRDEATAAAAGELQHVMQVIERAGLTPLVQGPSGCASLISTAAALYEKHTALIEAEAMEFLDDPFASHSVGPLLGGSVMRAPPGGLGGLGYPRRVRPPSPRPRQSGDAPAMPEWGNTASPICLRCGRPVSIHDASGCPPVGNGE